MTWEEMVAAIASAKALQQRADSMATQMAPLLVGRLRHVGSSHTLSMLKHELRDFNIHTGRWKAK